MVEVWAAWNPNGLIYCGSEEEAKKAVIGGEPPKVVRAEDAVYECNGLVMALDDSEANRDEAVKLLKALVGRCDTSTVEYSKTYNDAKYFLNEIEPPPAAKKKRMPKKKVEDEDGDDEPVGTEQPG